MADNIDINITPIVRNITIEATSREGTPGADGIANIVEDLTPQLGGKLDTNSKSIEWSKGADVASATELLLLQDGNYFDVTGTTTITSIETTADAWKVGSIAVLQFDGILTLTHHATNLILPSAANIVTAAGDIAFMQKVAAGDWKCVGYTRADGTALVSAGGAVNKYYRWSGLIDSPSSNNWVGSSKVSSTVNYADEFQYATGIVKGDSLLTLSFQQSFRIFASINGNQTITGLYIHTPNGILPDYIGMVVCSGGYSGTTFQYDVQTEILNMPLSLTRMVTESVSLVNFTSTSLSDGDVIYLFWGTTITSDLGPVDLELRTTID